jgi:hypothetical protein
MCKPVPKNYSLRPGALVMKCAKICGIARLHPGGGGPFPTALDFLIGHISVWQWRAVRREYPQNCSITINSTISAGGM